VTLERSGWTKPANPFLAAPLFWQRELRSPGFFSRAGILPCSHHGRRPVQPLGTRLLVSRLTRFLHLRKAGCWAGHASNQRAAAVAWPSKQSASRPFAVHWQSQRVRRPSASDGMTGSVVSPVLQSNNRVVGPGPANLSLLPPQICKFGTLLPQAVIWLLRLLASIGWPARRLLFAGVGLQHAAQPRPDPITTSSNSLNNCQPFPPPRIYIYCSLHRSCKASISFCSVAYSSQSILRYAVSSQPPLEPGSRHHWTAFQA
jgi:hypothetical protein